MRQLPWLCALPLCLALFSCPALAGQPNLDPQAERQLRAFENIVDELSSVRLSGDLDQHSSSGERMNQAFVALTGEAINPLFGVTVLGVYNYFRTDEAFRHLLPVYYQPEVWIPLVIIMLLMLFNSTICEAIPFLKIPLNALGDVVNKAGAIVVMPMVIKMFADSVAAPIGNQFAWLADGMFPAAYAAESAAASGGVWSVAGWIIGAAVGVVVYLAVWLTFNMVDVLILICPFPGVDAALKTFRLSIIGILAGTNQISPTAALIIALAVVLVSFLMAGWSFRLSVFGFVYSTDLLFFRKVPVSDAGVTAFSGDGLLARRKLPMRTLGRLEKGADGRLAFSYRPWLVFGRKRIELGEPGEFACGRGLLNPFLVADGQTDTPLLRLPPRYRGQEPVMTAAFGLNRIVDCGASGALRSWLASVFGKKAAAAQL